MPTIRRHRSPGNSKSSPPECRSDQLVRPNNGFATKPRSLVAQACRGGRCRRASHAGGCPASRDGCRARPGCSTCLAAARADGRQRGGHTLRQGGVRRTEPGQLRAAEAEAGKALAPRSSARRPYRPWQDRVDSGRKMALQILEFFDRNSVTNRRGDRRWLNRRKLDLFGDLAHR